MDKDYKKLYLEQKTISLNLEMQLMNMRAQMIEGERAGIDKELKECTGKEKKETKILEKLKKEHANQAKNKT
jgi:hypothetical protein